MEDKLLSGRMVSGRALVEEGSLVIFPTSMTGFSLLRQINWRVSNVGVFRESLPGNERIRVTPDLSILGAFMFAGFTQTMMNVSSLGIRNFYLSGFTFANPTLDYLDNYLLATGGVSGFYLDNVHFERSAADASTHIRIQATNNSTVSLTNVEVDCHGNTSEEPTCISLECNNPVFGNNYCRDTRLEINGLRLVMATEGGINNPPTEAPRTHLSPFTGLRLVNLPQFVFHDVSVTVNRSPTPFDFSFDDPSVNISGCISNLSFDVGGVSYLQRQGKLRITKGGSVTLNGSIEFFGTGFASALIRETNPDYRSIIYPGAALNNLELRNRDFDCATSSTMHPTVPSPTSSEIMTQAVRNIGNPGNLPREAHLTPVYVTVGALGAVILATVGGGITIGIVKGCSK